MPRQQKLNVIDPVRKTDTMKYLKTQLQKAQQNLIIAQKEKDAAREKKLQKIIDSVKGTIQNNS